MHWNRVCSPCETSESQQYSVVNVEPDQERRTRPTDGLHWNSTHVPEQGALDAREIYHFRGIHIRPFGHVSSRYPPQTDAAVLQTPLNIHQRPADRLGTDMMKVNEAGSLLGM